MNYAVMPLADYDAACDKVREKVDLTTVKFEETDFGFLRSEVFTVPQDSVYIFSYEFSDPSKFPDLYYSSPEWEGETSPGYFEPIDSNSAETASKLYAGVQYRIFIADSLGLTPKDILKASLLLDEETVVDFVPPPKIKSGELADKVDEVYMAGASDFGLKGKGQGELVTLNNVHPIEHKVEVGLSNKNLFNEAEANITKTDDYFSSNVGFSTDAFYSLAVEPNETYIATFMIRTEVEHVWGAELGVGIGSLPTYGNGRIALSLIPKESYQNFVTQTIRFTVPADVNIVYFQTVMGYKFKNFQIEKGTTPTAYTPFVADFSDCKIYARGKNLLNLEGRTVVNFGGWGDKKRIFPEGKGIILALAGSNYYSGANATDHIYSVGNGNIFYDQKGDYYGIGLDLPLTPNTTYKFSYGAMMGGVSLMEFDAEGNFLGQQYFSPVVKTKANTAWGVLLFSDMASVDISVTNPQLEFGATATEYEPYNEASTEYTAAADGTVEGIKSISPVMNISTDKAGAVIDAECFLDPQAVITDLTNTVITLGGEV